MKKKIVIALIVLALPLVVRQSLYSNIFDDIGDAFSSAANAVKDTAERAFHAAEDLGRKAYEGARDAATKAYEGAKTAASTVKEGVTDTANKIASGAESAARTVGQGIQTGAQTVGGGIESAAKTVGSGVKDAALQVGKGFEIAAKFVADRFKNTKLTRAVDYGIRKAGLESALAIATGVLQGAKGITQGTMIAAEQSAKGTLIASEEFLDKVGRNVTMAALKGPAVAAQGILEGAKQTTNAVLEAGKIIITKGVLGTFDINEISYHGELQELAQGSLGNVHVDMEILTQGIHPTITLDIKRGVEGVFDSFKSVINTAVDKIGDALFKPFKDAISSSHETIAPVKHIVAQLAVASPPQNLETIHAATQQAQQQVAALQAQQATAAQTIQQKLQETTHQAAQALAEQAQKTFCIVNLTAPAFKVMQVGDRVTSGYKETPVQLTIDTTVTHHQIPANGQKIQFPDGKLIPVTAVQPNSIITVMAESHYQAVTFTDSSIPGVTFYILQRDPNFDGNQDFTIQGVGQYVVTHTKPVIATMNVKFLKWGLQYIPIEQPNAPLSITQKVVNANEVMSILVYIVDGKIISPAYIMPVP